MKNTVNTIDFESIINAFGLTSTAFSILPYGTGHINRTFLISNKDEGEFILQQINQSIFKTPEFIASNWRNAKLEIEKQDPEYLMVDFIQTIYSADFYIDIYGAYWRLLPYIKNTFSFETIADVQQAYDAAYAFGNFTTLLKHAQTEHFYTILSGFHDLSLRQKQFEKALKKCSIERGEKSSNLIQNLNSHQWITTYYENIINTLPVRIMHMDAKISNLLFDAETKQAKCIIDLDTLMPGTILSDFGDLVRSSICSANEDETDLSKIQINADFLKAVHEGYRAAFYNELTENEINALPFAGPMLVYMQALRFLTDFLNNDCYYSINYPEHNFDRAMNQYVLLTRLLAEPFCKSIRN